MIFNRAALVVVVSTSLLSSAALAEVTGSDQPLAETPAAAAPPTAAPPTAAPLTEAPSAEAPAVDAPAAAPSQDVQPAPAVEPAPPAAAAAGEEAPAPVAAAPGSAATVTVGQNSLPAPTEGAAQVVFYRPSKMVGMALSFSVREEGKGLGKLGNGSFFVLTAAPGTHTYTIESEVTDKLTLEVDAGEVYYVEQTIGMGVMMGRPHLAPSTADAFGRKALKVSTRKGTDDSELAQNQAAAPPAK